MESMQWLRLSVVAALMVWLAACDSDGTAPAGDTGGTGGAVSDNGGGGGVGDEGPEAGGETPTFWGDIDNVLAPYCSGCHGLAGCAAGKCFLDDYAVMSEPAGEIYCEAGMTIAECIPYTVRQGTMPTDGCEIGSATCLSQEELDRVEAWVAGGAPE